MVKLRKNAWAYTGRTGWQGVYRIDAVCVVLDENNNPKRINHYENIAKPGLARNRKYEEEDKQKK